ncbi:MAG: hypothetical protein AABZ34_04925 [Nitrospirota bacterium]
MKKILMVARFFPPEGSATSFRTLRFVRQLSKLGWNVTVVTATPSQYERHDAKLVTTVPSQVRVIRAKGYDLWQWFQSWRFRRIEQQSAGRQSDAARKPAVQGGGSLRAWAREMVRRVEAWWYQPDVDMPWIRPGVKACLDVCADQRPTIIWANAGRLAAFRVVREVSKHTGVPYVLDFDDAWTVTSNDHDRRRPRAATGRIRRDMYELLKGAHAVVFRYESEAECFWRAYRGALQASRVYIIPNGFEAPIDRFEAPAGERCTVLYSGTLPDYRYDTLLSALGMLKEQDPEGAKQLLLRFVGEGMEPLAAEVNARGLSAMVETSGPTSFDEVSRLQREAHALLALGRPATMKGYELFAGAKLFGYLKGGRPIIGVLPPDETKQALIRVGVRTIADVDSVPEIVAVLQMLLAKWSARDLESLVPDRKACEAYSSERQTEILVRALEGVPPEKPFVPGAQPIPPSLREIEDPKWLEGGR